ncbi:MAG: hypothetical protein DWQ18_06740 [Crenarchaeota archaeon]|nr:MAG: hypothetical protein DWQ17_03045 [Thermoproteota archaeon]RDJ32882.1 MAG: hypothetical protein DWQ18_06740 [Thermoproteota archaeon]RDJ36036.1 MAG: hypothetical protein DWQ13_09130 [Thermoproteota archaeon]RDJ38284.1 MAG: hypothetical protein DWQ19_00435 [Thermoproteota archaeon]
MVKQISLDAWQIQHLTELLRKASLVVAKTNSPIILYRQTLEEEGESYEEIVCTLTQDHIIEQLVTSGGVLPPTFHEQFVFSIDEYPEKLIRKSRDRFLQIVSLLENQLK